MTRFPIIFLTGLALNAAAVGQPLSITPRRTAALPASAVDQFGAPFTIAGLSGITRRSGDEFLAVLDNSNKIVRIAMTFSSNGSIVSATVVGGLSLSETRDFEGIAMNTVTGDSVFLAEEGSPAVHEFSLQDGARLRTLTIPSIFAQRRENFGFESLTRRGLTGDVWTANEEALTSDGPVSTSGAGTWVRVLRFAFPSLEPSSQWAYQTQPLHGSPISGSRSGLSDLVALPSGKLISLERSLAFSLTGPFQSRIYELDPSAATDVASIASLASPGFTAVGKRLLYSGSLNNLEGLCLGPRVSAAAYALVGVVDDGDPLSNNELAAFELSGGVACIADFNDDDRFSVQDLFDFLAAYFSGASSADVNGLGGVSVQDIFDFLVAYFTGCGA